MTVFEAIALGIIQGITELLPISSSAHLLLARWLFGLEEGGLAVDVALHLGTLVAILWFFRDQWIALARAAANIVVTRRIQSPVEYRVLLLIIATIPAGIGGLLLEDIAETTFRNPGLAAVNLMVMGMLLWAVDRWRTRTRQVADLRWSDALLIGLAQVAALVPGVSRSGSTITAARALGLDRESAAVFSFLMAMPITAAAVLLKVPDAVGEVGLSLPLIAGVVAAALSSWAAIAILLRYVAKHSYGIFAVYRVIVGITVLYLLFGRG